MPSPVVGVRVLLYFYIKQFSSLCMHIVYTWKNFLKIFNVLLTNQEMIWFCTKHTSVLKINEKISKLCGKTLKVGVLLIKT